jgi:protein TonB
VPGGILGGVPGGLPGFGGVQVGPGEGEPPVAIYKPACLYPPEARRNRVEGVVILLLVVRRDGTVGPIRVVRSVDRTLDQAAIECVRQWRFRPGTLRGQPVDALFSLTIAYSIQGGS